MAEIQVDVAIVGGGPAGLGAALELRRLGVARVLILDREEHAGGIPRHCRHPSFGWREFRRLLGGPEYARRLVNAAIAAGVEIRTRHSVVNLKDGGVLEATAPEGRRLVRARRVILAAGARETPLSARLAPGDRAMGCLTTGALQSFLYGHGLLPFRRPLIVGTEIVSLSAILTCRSAGIRPAAVIEANGQPTARKPLSLLPRLYGIPVYYGAQIADIRGRSRVETVTVQLDGGGTREIACDGVLCTGRFVPETGVVRASHLEMDSGTAGPSVDQFGRCSDPAYFAAGNVLRPVETAGWCYREGRQIGGFVARDLSGALPDWRRSVPVARAGGVRFAVPQRICVAPGGEGLENLQLRFDRRGAGELVVGFEGREVMRRKMSAAPERRVLVRLAEIRIPASAKSIPVEFRYSEQAAQPHSE